MTPAQPTVVIVDDHPVFRRGLATLLAEEGIAVLAQAGTVADALAAVAAHQPDVAILDLHLPDGSGVPATRQIVAAHPGVHVLVLTMDSADATALAALRAGARGYLLKEAAAESIVSTVQALARGELVLGSRLAHRLAGMLSLPAASAPGLAGLTPRELEIMALVARGMSNTEIGRTLFLAEKTVRNNITALLAKTALPSRSALIAFARDRDITLPRPHVSRRSVGREQRVESARVPYRVRVRSASEYEPAYRCRNSTATRIQSGTSWRK
jgi:DNA-binding NarL/FixJ family response regulator